MCKRWDNMKVNKADLIVKYYTKDNVDLASVDVFIYEDWIPLTRVIKILIKEIKLLKKKLKKL